MKSLLLLATTIISTHASAMNMSLKDINWVINQPEIKEIFKDNSVIASERNKMCRARFCYEYILCSGSYNEATEKPEFVTVVVDGQSIFFKSQIRFEVKKSDKMPEECKMKKELL